ncbi:MAG TPA: phenylalanine--tRNA ligase subunit beta [Bacteroidota bacterium]|nr:phenylalanine--tRNA ligase subunit beta [Bacteroidota bacterium]
MRVSYRWLKDYVDIKASPEELAQKLTMTGFEVEKIERPGEKYKNFVTGIVLETRKHPNADKLTLCKVDVGSQTLNIVCGAPNVSPGQAVAVGLVGAQVPRNQHDPAGAPFVLSQVKIRGEESFGMICSAYELDLGDDRDGIMILPKGTATGTTLSDYLGLSDTILEIGITPNRPDAMSHIGIAREVGAIYNKKVKIPKLKLRESKRPAAKFGAIKILDSGLCPRYTARLVYGVTIGPSPKWLQEYLTSIGVRPVNNVVDVTNFVLMEMGHPLHAFDYDKLNEGMIVVKPAKDGEEFTTLDHKLRRLTSSTLMICDAKGPVAIAGVMGGAFTEISDTTKNILIESAYFNPQSIRRTSKRLGLSTEASQRFERGADLHATQWAADRAAQLIQEITGGEILKGVIDVFPGKKKSITVPLRPEKANEVLGTGLSGKQIQSLLRKINITKAAGRSKSGSSNVLYAIPSYRVDLLQEIDLVEEVARMYGYDSIETNNDTRISFSSHAPAKDTVSELKDWLIGSGYSEVVSNSMQEKEFSRLGSEEAVEIANPISKDMATLRTSLIVSMVQVIRNNILYGKKNLRLFEVGKIYRRDKTGASVVPGYREENRLTMAMVGLRRKASWDVSPQVIDIYDLKGELQTLFRKIFLDNIKFIPYSNTKALTSMGFDVEINGIDVGYAGIVRKDFRAKFDIDEEIVIAELNVDLLLQNSSLKKTFKPLPKYPSVTRDIAFKINENITADQLKNEIAGAAGPMLVQIDLFDIYRGDQVKAGEKSLAFALEFMSEDHTLRQDEVDRIMKEVISRVSRNLSGTLRE